MYLTVAAMRDVQCESIANNYNLDIESTFRSNSNDNNIQHPGEVSNKSDGSRGMSCYVISLNRCVFGSECE